jgi:predicted transcriptional regulator
VLAIPADVGDAGYGELAAAARDAESALWLLRSLLARRSEEGWELVELLDQGLSRTDAADRLGISPSAVSQRLGRAARQEAQRGTELTVRLLERLRATATGVSS